MEETVPKVRGAADVTIIGLMVSLNRMEVGLGGKGHEAVGENGVEPLAKIISRVKLSRHCSTHPFRR